MSIRKTIARRKAIRWGVGVLGLLILACSDSSTDPKPLPQHKLAYGYYFGGWPNAISESAVAKTAEFCNTLVLEAREATLQADLDAMQKNNIKAILDVSQLFRNSLSLNWETEWNKLAAKWQGRESAIAAFLIADKPLSTEHKVGNTVWRWWSVDELQDLVTFTKSRAGEAELLIVFAPTSDLEANIPTNLDWIGIEFFPFTFDKTLTREEFTDGYNGTNGETILGFQQYINKVKAAAGDENQPIVLVGQSFGYTVGNKFPPTEAFVWYYDLIAKDPAIVGLLWWKAFGNENGVFPYELNPASLVLSEKLPSVVKTQREIGERVTPLW